MLKAFYSIVLLTFACLALIFALSPIHAGAAPLAAPCASSNASISGINHDGIDDLKQPESSGPMLALSEAQAEEHYCARHCRRLFEKRLRECNEPEHPHHRRCKAWAGEREKACLDNCYREHGR